MRVLTYVLCGICLAGGAVTSLAMTQLSPADDQSSGTAPARNVEPARSGELFNYSDVNYPDVIDSEVRQEVSDPFGTDPAANGPNIPSRSSNLDNPAAVGNMPSRGPMRPRQVRRTVIQTYMEPVPAEELAAAKKLQEAIKSLNNSSEPEAQKKATDTIQQQLSEQFDLDLKEREKELAEVEAKVKSLREQLDKRKAAREDIISLRLKTITNDAAGLGFPDGGGASEAFERFGPSLPYGGLDFAKPLPSFSTLPQKTPYPVLRSAPDLPTGPPVTRPAQPTLLQE